MNPAIPCLSTIAEVRAALDEARARGASIGLVPTMGALHEGHLSLIEAARAENDVVVVSIFVNPTQFGPRKTSRSIRGISSGTSRSAKEAGADLVFSPTAEEMYPDAYSTWVDVEGLTDGLCGRSRPGHFRGVCTVVTKLFNICQPRPGLLRREGCAAAGGHPAHGARPGYEGGDRPVSDGARSRTAWP